MKHILIIHPFLFAIYPLLAVMAGSINLLDSRQAIRPAIVILTGTSVLLCILYMIHREWARAGFITSILVMMLLYYGYSYRLPREVNVSGFSLSRHILILFFWGVFISIVSSRWLWNRIRPQVITNLLNLSSALALLIPIYGLGTHWITTRTDPLETWSRPVNQIEDFIRLEGNYKPDIYYIILDGYARGDVLQEEYAFNNAAFLADLSSRGFFIADQSHSNYAQTQLSLASSLNFEYLDYLSFVSGISSNHDPLAEMILASHVRSLFENYGYQFYISGEYLFAEVRDPAIMFHEPKAYALTTFESLLLESTMFEILIDTGWANISNYTYQTHREKILNGFAMAERLVESNSPKFVFVHIIAPHIPFVFDQNGNPTQPDWEYTIFEGSQITRGLDNYITGYRAQLAYINQLSIATIDHILQNSSSAPIIILQSDHGPGSQFGNTVEASCLKERFSILNAIYLPEGNEIGLYPSITPVNTFRLIFNAYFGTDLKILPDISYFSNWDNPYGFTDVTAQVDTPCKLPNQP